MRALMAIIVRDKRQNTSKEELENTERLHYKNIKHIKDYTFFEYDKQDNRKCLNQI